MAVPSTQCMRTGCRLDVAEAYDTPRTVHIGPITLHTHSHKGGEPGQACTSLRSPGKTWGEWTRLPIAKARPQTITMTPTPTSRGQQLAHGETEPYPSCLLVLSQVVSFSAPVQALCRYHGCSPPSNSDHPGRPCPAISFRKSRTVGVDRAVTLRISKFLGSFRSPAQPSPNRIPQAPSGESRHLDRRLRNIHTAVSSDPRRPWSGASARPSLRIYYLAAVSRLHNIANRGIEFREFCVYRVQRL